MEKSTQSSSEKESLPIKKLLEEQKKVTAAAEAQAQERKLDREKVDIKPPEQADTILQIEKVTAAAEAQAQERKLDREKTEQIEKVNQILAQKTNNLTKDQVENFKSLKSILESNELKNLKEKKELNAIVKKQLKPIEDKEKKDKKEIEDRKKREEKDRKETVKPLNKILEAQKNIANLEEAQAQERKFDREKVEQTEKINQILAQKTNNLTEEQIENLKSLKSVLEGNELQTLEDKKEANELTKKQLEALEDIKNDNDDLNKLLGTINQKQEGFFKKFLGDKIGGIVSTVISAATGALLGGTGFIASLSASFAPVISGLKIFGSLVSKLALPLTILIGVVGGLFKGFKRFGDEGIAGFIKGFFEGFLDSTIGVIIDSFGFLLKKIGGLFGLGEEMGAVVDTIKLLFNAIKDNFESMVDIIKAIFTGDFELFKEAIMNIGKNFVEVFKSILLNALPALGKLILFDLKTRFVTLPSMLFKAVFFVFKLLGEAIKALFITLPGFIGKWIGETFAEGILKIVGAFKAVFIDLPLMIKDKFVSFFTEFLPQLFKDIGGAIKEGFNKLISFFTNLPDVIGSSMGDVGDMGKKFLKSILSTILPKKDDGAKWFNPMNLAHKAIPKSVYEFAGIRKDGSPLVPPGFNADTMITESDLVGTEGMSASEIIAKRNNQGSELNAQQDEANDIRRRDRRNRSSNIVDASSQVVDNSSRSSSVTVAPPPHADRPMISPHPGYAF